MLETGTVLQDRFLIEEPLGRGGMGAVYIATDQKFGSRVAIKERAYEDPELAAAFEREARLLNSLHHPILPHVSDYFVENGGHFLVMEYIEGDDLSEIISRHGAFSVEDVVRWTLELLDGLDYLHSQDPPIVHRDIKPHNLKITSRGNVVLLDFGLAKETSGNAQGVRSVFGYSRRYSPLEQIEGVGTDARSDIFSLGATVYHLLTGSPPVDVLARASTIVAGKPDPLELANVINRDVPADVASVIDSALALNADRRFVSARAMSMALQQPNEPVHEAVASTEKASAVEPAQAVPILAGPETNDSNVSRSLASEWIETMRRFGRRVALAARDHESWVKPVALMAAVLLGLAVMSVVFLRSGESKQSGDVSGEHGAVINSNEDVPADSSQQEASAQPEDVPSLDQRSEVAKSKPLQRPISPVSVSLPDRTVDNATEPVSSDDAAKVERRSKTAVRDDDKESSNVRRSGRGRQTQSADGWTRPRVVRSDPYRHSPVSSIETIFTGVGANRRSNRSPY